MRRSFSGTFRCENLGHDHWRLLRTDAPRVEIHVRGNQSPQGCGASETLSVEWRTAAAVLSVQSPRGAQDFTVDTALLHEPLPELYDALPLARFDARAKRFWRRVFLLVRLPGGRRLLGLLARRA